MASKIVPHAILDRIRALYDLPSDAAMARKLKIAPQDIPRFRKTGNTPYKQILNEVHPKEWEYVFHGRRSSYAQPLAEAIRHVEAAGLAVISKDALRSPAGPPAPEGASPEGSYP